MDRIGTSVNASVILEEITQGEQDGTNDLYVTIVMRQWRKPRRRCWRCPAAGAQTDRDTRTGAASARTYTVESGDCLWSIAQKFYGSGAQYKRLAAANPAITNPNLIYPARC